MPPSVLIPSHRGILLVLILESLSPWSSTRLALSYLPEPERREERSKDGMYVHHPLSLPTHIRQPTAYSSIDIRRHIALFDTTLSQIIPKSRSSHRAVAHKTKDVSVVGQTNVGPADATPQLAIIGKYGVPGSVVDVLHSLAVRQFSIIGRQALLLTAFATKQLHWFTIVAGAVRLVLDHSYRLGRRRSTSRKPPDIHFCI
ncbi:hypothetical protein BJV78DRAFT_1155309 [Lactifluus subvellereus]|nr:hypothetical protein BJV78DRAFT_1155309 [Lactifluus subvellereus]